MGEERAPEAGVVERGPSTPSSVVRVSVGQCMWALLPRQLQTAEALLLYARGAAPSRLLVVVGSPRWGSEGVYVVCAVYTVRQLASSKGLCCVAGRSVPAGVCVSWRWTMTTPQIVALECRGRGWHGLRRAWSCDDGQTEV